MKKWFLACLLLPAIVGEIRAVAALAGRWFPSGEWQSLWVLAFFGGGLLWLLIFWFLPRTLWVYVLGHELTHALAVYLSGGTVFSFKVDSGGGHIQSDRVNWFIALSPYIVPLYSLIWCGLWISVDFYYPLDRWQWIYYAGIGFTWAFHLCFTISMIRLGQTDISSQGSLFSAVVILGLNLLFLLVTFVAASPGLEWRDSAVILVRSIGEAYQVSGHWIVEGVIGLRDWVGSRFNLEG